MTIAYVNSNSISASSISVGEAFTAGDTILVCQNNTTAGAPTDNAIGGSNTYTLLHKTTNTSIYGCLSCKAASALSLTITSAGGAGTTTAYAHYRGVGSFDAVAFGNTGTTSVPSLGSLTFSASGETIVAAVAGSSAQTAGASFTIRDTSSITAWEDLIGAPLATETVAFGSSVVSWLMIAVALSTVPVSAVSDVPVFGCRRPANQTYLRM